MLENSVSSNAMDELKGENNSSAIKPSEEIKDMTKDFVAELEEDNKDEKKGDEDSKSIVKKEITLDSIRKRILLTSIGIGLLSSVLVYVVFEVVTSIGN